VALVGALLLVLSDASVGGEKKAKDVTVKGKVTCAKCDLMQTDACATVIVTKKDGKETVLFFDPASHKKNHAAVCQAPKDGSVTGTIAEKDGKKVITVKSVKFD